MPRPPQLPPLLVEALKVGGAFGLVSALDALQKRARPGPVADLTRLAQEQAAAASQRTLQSFMKICDKHNPKPVSMLQQPPKAEFDHIKDAEFEIIPDQG